MVKNPPVGIQRITVRIAYENPKEALQFLNDAFDFPERKDSRLEGKGGSIIVTEIQVGDGYIMIGPAGSHSIASPTSTGAPTESLMIYVDDVDGHYERAKSAGAEIVSPPADQYWGDRRYEAKDTEGHLWFFHQRTRDVPRAEIDAFEAKFKE